MSVVCECDFWMRCDYDRISKAERGVEGCGMGFAEKMYLK